MMHPVRGRRGIAVAPHALASESAIAVLREGGNAVEAMISAAALIAVAYPHMNGLGGDSFWLVSTPDDGMHGIEGCGGAAEGVALADYAGLAAIPYRGPRAAITMAGTVSAWDAAFHFSRERLGGRLPLQRLLADAIDAACHGVAVTASQARGTHAKREELSKVAGFSDTFLVDGEAPIAGSLFRQPRIAATLSQLAHAGLQDFYRGDLARSMAADLGRLGSPLGARDFPAHHAAHSTPLRLAHATGDVFNMPPPTQGLVSLLILGIMDRLPRAHWDPLGADFIHATVEATKLAFAERDAHLADPRVMRIRAQDLLTNAHLDALAAKVNPALAAGGHAGDGPADTVWLGIIDGQGRAVSMIQSIYHEFGSGLVLPETGIHWQNRGASFSLDASHVNHLAPGKKPFHTLNPAIARRKDGTLMVYGSMGGDGQPQNQAIVFHRQATFGLDAQASVTLPRWLFGRTWGDPSETLKLESRFPEATIDQLVQRGHTVEMLDAFDETCGHAGCVARSAGGALEGGFDPRSDGAAVAF